jgi:hypothetical protein
MLIYSITIYNGFMLTKLCIAKSQVNNATY